MAGNNLSSLLTINVSSPSSPQLPIACSCVLQREIFFLFSGNWTIDKLEIGNTIRYCYHLIVHKSALTYSV